MTKTALLQTDAYDWIRRDILRCNLRPGQEITEGTLSNRYTLGKAPIRSALQRLQQDGLVISVPRRGYQITPITYQNVKETFQLRMILEPRAAEMAAGRLTAEQLVKMRELCEVVYDPGDKESESHFLEANRLFHCIVANASGNTRIAEIVNQLLSEVERVLHLCLEVIRRGEGFQAEHLELLEALMSGEAKKAGELVYEQVRAGQTAVFESLLFSDKTAMTMNQDDGTLSGKPMM